MGDVQELRDAAELVMLRFKMRQLQELATHWHNFPHEGGSDAWGTLTSCANDIEEILKEGYP